VSREPRLSDTEFANWWRETGERELRIVLLWRWDPIGVARAYPATEDEYDDYAAPLARALWNGADADQLTDRLLRIEEDTMGLSSTDDDHRAVAARFIVGWYDQSVHVWRWRGPRQR
jgi:hypothetical protein